MYHVANSCNVNMSICVAHHLIFQTYSQKGPSVHQCLHPQRGEVEVQIGENYSEQATLRDSVLAYREDNDSAESTSLSAWSILQTLQGNKDKLVQQSFLSCMSHLAYTFILSFWRFLKCSLSHSFSVHLSMQLGKMSLDLTQYNPTLPVRGYIGYIGIRFYSFFRYICWDEILLRQKWAIHNHDQLINSPQAQMIFHFY